MMHTLRLLSELDKGRAAIEVTCAYGISRDGVVRERVALIRT